MSNLNIQMHHNAHGNSIRFVRLQKRGNSMWAEREAIITNTLLLMFYQNVFLSNVFNLIVFPMIFDYHFLITM